MSVATRATDIVKSATENVKRATDNLKSATEGAKFASLPLFKCYFFNNMICLSTGTQARAGKEAAQQLSTGASGLP